jgi:ribosomal protein S18 acetylase RimI-like enzyme
LRHGAIVLRIILVEMAGVESLLDNPMYSALTTRHAARAIGAGQARRYPPAVAPFAGVAEASDEARRDLEGIVAPGEAVGILGVIPPGMDRWEVRKAFGIYQYVFEGAVSRVPDADIERLGEEDLEAMLELAALVYPAYFRRETVALGPYIGVKEGGRLCAMAGIRMAVDGGQEISAVCTHPDFRGQGLASRLTRDLVRRIQNAGDVAYLHTEEDNGAAQSVYERLGFRRRAVLPFRVMEFRG